jgi:hypothetical protein
LLTSTSSFTVTPDTADPTGGALTVNSTVASGAGTTSSSNTTAFAIGVRTNYTTDAGSGVASSVLTVQSETFSNNTCGLPGSGGPFTSPTTISGTTQPGGIVSGFCYLYTLTGTDNVGNDATISTTVKVDTAAPSGSITAPAAGATVGGIVAVDSSDAADTGGSGVASVQFQVKPAASGSFTNINAADTSSPYSTNWDTSSVANGNYLLRAIVTDNATNTFTTAQITVTVSNAFTVSAPGSATAGSQFSVTITKKTAGVTDTSYTGSHTIVFSGPASAPNGQAPTYPASVTFSNGIGTASVTLFKAETTAITATESNTSGTSSNIVVNAAAASAFKLVNCAIGGSSTPCGSSFAQGNGSTLTFNVAVTDAWGNTPAPVTVTVGLALTGNGSIFSFASGGAVTSTSTNITSGTQSGTVSVFKRANPNDTQTVTLSAAGYASLQFTVTK